MNERLNQISEGIIGAAIAVHREMGPGLLESAYEACLTYELVDRGYTVLRQQEVPVVYRGVKLDCGIRLDLLVNDLVIVELKSVDKLNSVHEAQTLTYLKLTGLRLALLINFNEARLIEGLKRFVLS